MDNDRQCVDDFAVDQDVHLHQIRLSISDQFVVERGIASRHRFELIEVFKDDLAQRHLIDQLIAVLVEVEHLLVDAALVL